MIRLVNICLERCPRNLNGLINTKLARRLKSLGGRPRDIGADATSLPFFEKINHPKRMVRERPIKPPMSPIGLATSILADGRLCGIFLGSASLVAHVPVVVKQAMVSTPDAAPPAAPR